MGEEWHIIYYQEDDGTKPAKAFRESRLTGAEKKRLQVRLQLLAQKGLRLLLERSDILDEVEGEDNLYELRLPNSPNNPRFLICALSGKRLVLLHGFAKKGRKLPNSDRAIGARRRDKIVAAEENAR